MKPLKLLKNFSLEILAKNSSILSTSHDLERSTLNRRKKLTTFIPGINFNFDNSKSANRSYNPNTGLEEDYSTRRSGLGTSIGQRTFLGDASLDFSKSKTEYTSASTSYFQSVYLSLKTGIFRRDFRLNKLERQLADLSAQADQAQVDSIVLDVLMSSYRALFNLVLSNESNKIKQQNLDFYTRLVEEAQIKLKNGMGSKLDLKQAKMRLQQAEIGLDETDLQISSMDHDMGLKFSVTSWNREYMQIKTAKIAESVPRKFDKEALLELAFKCRPDYRLLKSQYQTQKSTLLWAKEKRRPDISTRVRWGKQGRGPSRDLAKEMKDKSWDVVVSWNTKFGPQPETLNYRIERERLKAMALKISQRELEIRKAIFQTVDKLLFYHKNLKLVRESKNLSAEVLEGQQLNFKLGKISLLDLSRYQQDFDSTSLLVAQTESKLVLSWLELLYETGRTIEGLDLNKDFKTKVSSGAPGILESIIPVEAEN